MVDGGLEVEAASHIPLYVRMCFICDIACVRLAQWLVVTAVVCECVTATFEPSTSVHVRVHPYMATRVHICTCTTLALRMACVEVSLGAHSICAELCK